LSSCLPVDHSVPGLPRLRLALLPSPLHRGLALESGTEVLIKRDDLIGPLLGGNKVRKLEFLMADAVASGAEVVVGGGAWHSNFARVLAGFARICGIPCELILLRPGGPGKEGPAEHLNARLARKWGARIDYVTGDFSDLARLIEVRAAELAGKGVRAYALAPGGSVPRGAVAFALAYSELMGQLAQLGVRASAVVLASSTLGTAAGLAAGRALYLANARRAGARTPLAVPRVIGVSVVPGGPGKLEAVKLANDVLALLHKGEPPDPAPHLEVVGGYAGRAYGAETEAGRRAAEVALKRLGVVLDECYTAKAFSALLDLDARGELGGGEAVVFWHTGGIPLGGVDDTPAGRNGL
jgi:L-cysteate sulfo-lyase